MSTNHELLDLYLICVLVLQEEVDKALIKEELLSLAFHLAERNILPFELKEQFHRKL